MSHVRVQALGGFAVAARGGHDIPIAGSCRPVLAYLLTHRQRPVSKVELAETLWSDRDGTHARHCLATALWRIRKVATQHAPSLLMHGSDEIAFDRTAPMWVDSIAMEQRLGALTRRKPDTLSLAELMRIQRGVRLYRGDYLVGMEQEWAWLERQRLRHLYCDGLYQLVMAYGARQEWERVIEWGRLLNRAEPLREDVHRWLMLAGLHTGNRASAMAQYRQCQRVLSSELGVEPMAQTQALYRQLLTPDATPSAPSSPPHMSAAMSPLERARQRVARARRLLRACERQLDNASGLLDAPSNARD